MGGSGGAQRALRSIIRALADDEVDVVARKRVPEPPHARSNSIPRIQSNLHWRWRGSDSRHGINAVIARFLVNPLRRALLPRYDIYIRLFQGADLSNAVSARLKLIVPSGNTIPQHLSDRYDFVAMQAPDNVGLLQDPSKGVLIRPPLYELSEQSSKPDVELPEEFFLTAFNPYGPIKGTNDLARVIDEVPVPIVWCHSRDSLTFDIPAELHGHPNLVHVESPSPAELRYLYERCAAYLCFSLTEGFGWSIADGLRYSPSVVSRRVGILTNPEAIDERVFLVDDSWSVDWASVIERASGPSSGQRLEWHAAAKFRDRLVELLTRQG